METLHINEIYTSIQGEGLRAGCPTIFIRTQGCSLRCSWCDTLYGLPFAEKALKAGEGMVKTMEELLIQVDSFPNSFTDICLTGGDPLQQKHTAIKVLIDELYRRKFIITIETGGHIPTRDFIDTFDNQDYGESVSFCVDYKLAQSSMNSKMKPKAFDTLRHHDSVKYVVADEVDWDMACTHLAELRQDRFRGVALFSPVWDSSLGIVGLTDLVNSINGDLHPARLSLQLHKIIWEPTLRRT